MSETGNPLAAGGGAREGVVVDELHLTLRVPNDLPADHIEAIRRTLAGTEFVDGLQRAVRTAVRAFPELNAVKASITR